MENIKFLLRHQVIRIHELQIQNFGGMHGVRDMNLLESAIMTPQFCFAGKFVHATIHSMSAAYIYHIIKNHPFNDGNKRTGVACGIIFLIENGVPIERLGSQVFDLAIKVATNAMNKEQLTGQLLLLSKNTVKPQ